MICKGRKRRTPKHDPGWQYVVDNWDQLWRLCGRLGRKQRPDLIEELFSDVIVVHVPNLVRRWSPDHPSGMPLSLWVNTNIRRYICKWFLAKGIHERRNEPLPSDLPTPRPVLNSVEQEDGQVEAVLSLLSPLDQTILTAVYLDGSEGMTHRDIAKAIGMSSKSKGNELVQGALVRARQAAMAAALERSRAYRARHQ